MLPATYNTPLYWSNEELQMLKGSAAFLEALQLHKHVARQFAYFHVALRVRSTRSQHLPCQPSKLCPLAGEQRWSFHLTFVA